MCAEHVNAYAFTIKIYAYGDAVIGVSFTVIDILSYKMLPISMANRTMCSIEEGKTFVEK